MCLELKEMGYADDKIVIMVEKGMEDRRSSLTRS